MNVFDALSLSKDMPQTYMHTMCTVLCGPFLLWSTLSNHTLSDMLHWLKVTLISTTISLDL